MTGSILIVIPCLNEEAHLERLVHDLVRNSQDLPARIVIADGGSTDRTRSIARELSAQYPGISFLHNPKRLQSAAVNLAVESLGDGSDLLIRLDAHSEYPADYCHALVAEEKATGAASVVTALDTIGKGWFQKAAAAAQNSKLGNGGSAHRNTGGNGQWVEHGHHALMRIDAFRAVGGYDETFSHNEDAELDIRLRKAGYKIWLTGKTSLSYYPRSSAVALFRQYYRFGHGRARTIMKHRVLPRLRQLLPTAIAPAFVLAFLTPVFWVAALPLASWAAICLSYGVLLAVKAGDAEIAASGPAAMLMHLGWSFGFWSEMLRGQRMK